MPGFDVHPFHRVEQRRGEFRAGNQDGMACAGGVEQAARPVLQSALAGDDLKRRSRRRRHVTV
jgi:hypothetical protein